MALSVPKFSIGNSFYLSGSLPDGAGVLTVVPGTTFDLTNGKTYSELDVLGSCTVTTEFQLIHNDDGTLVVVLDFFVGPGQYSFSPHLGNVELTAGSGVQQLFVRAINYDTPSDLFATLSGVENDD